MCGIAGIIAARPLSPHDKNSVSEMTSRLAHRGPDGEGFYSDPFAALGHRRLAIVDLEGGRQPISTEDGSIQAVVNGEFYDFQLLRSDLQRHGHRLRTKGDSECLPHLYEDHGAGCLEHVNGMFAFAIWDARNRMALLARDRLGVKPLYYHFDNERLIFASELKGVLAAPDVPRELDPEALLDYFTFGFIPSPKTIYKHIRKLPPATFLVFRDGRLRAHEYWDLRFRSWASRSQRQVTDELWENLRTATERRLIADVPLGAFLSGGIDSTAVVAAMCGVQTEPITSLTCGFDERDFDERTFARLAATRLSTVHRETVAAMDLDTIIDRLAIHFDEPFADASAIPTYYLSREAKRHVTVALSGDGGDEVLAGYRRYRFDKAEERVRRAVPAGIRAAAFGAIGRRWPIAQWMPRMIRAGATFRNLSVDGATGHGLSISTLHPKAARELLSADLASELRDYDPLDTVRQAFERCDAPDHLSKCQFADIRFGLADGILAKVDRASMAHGLEVRSPMLDYRFVEFAWSIPPAFRLRGSQGKYLLRKLVAERVDSTLGSRTKRGFESPIDDWITDHWANRLETSDSPAAAWLDMEAIRQIWLEHRSNRRVDGTTLWKFLMLDAWARAHHRAEASIEGHSPMPESLSCTP